MYRDFLRRLAYNAGMDPFQAGAGRPKSESRGEMDGWLRDGGLVVTASDRAARAITAEFHGARQAEGLAAWPAPNVLDWKSFVRAGWEKRALDSRLLLNSTQEQALWDNIAGDGRQLATLLDGPSHRLAGMAMEAHSLLCAYAPRFLEMAARVSWVQDAGAFSGWLAAFDELCRADSLLSPSRLPLELIPLLKRDQPPLLLAGFDRILPVQRRFFDAWGQWREAASAQPARQIRLNEATDTQAELAACATWCGRRITANPHSRLLVITQDAGKRRGEIERAFLKHAGHRASDSGASRLFEFSLGVPLSRVGLGAGAHLVLRWLSGPIAEQELDWLLSTGQIAISPQESSALQGYMRALRRRGLERTHWTLADFINQSCRQRLPASWVGRMLEAQHRLRDFYQRTQSPINWAELVPQLLETLGWPGYRPLASVEYQAFNRWQQALETAGSLGFDGRRMDWQEFLSVLRRILDETLVAPESTGAPVQIAGPAESAGLTADAVWFLDANEDAWPAGGVLHPLLPPEVQREAGMPHATPQLDWELGRAITSRLLAAAPEVHFSYARQHEGVEARPSPLILQLAGPPQPLPPELIAPSGQPPLTVAFQDATRIPFPPGKAAGGANVLTFQSQCPFKAFATAHLAAQSWQPAQASLTPSQRGQMLHAVLHSVWAGPPLGIRTYEELQALADRRAFVTGHVSSVLGDEVSAGLRQRMPRRYLELEGLRLTRLVSEWLDYEVTRRPFAVANTEVDTEVNVAGLILKLRLDRVDKLNDGSLLVIDYKSGDVWPKAWDLPRPDDVQLPLYAGFGLGEEDELGGLVFAKVRPGNYTFAGRVGDAEATLFEGLSGNNALVKSALTAEQLIDWRDCIEQLARDFLAGRAEVEPRDPPDTCKRCGLQTICRIHEGENNSPGAGDDSDCDGSRRSEEAADD
jgi:probable DNA repair protein